MSTGNQCGAEQDTQTCDAVVEEFNFDPESPDMLPHPDHPGPGVHVSHNDGAKDDHPTEDPHGEDQQS